VGVSLDAAGRVTDIRHLRHAFDSEGWAL
jgi:hypothetical protein